MVSPRYDHFNLDALDRCRSAWMETRTARINTLRGLLREFGLILPVGAATALKQIFTSDLLRSDVVPIFLDRS